MLPVLAASGTRPCRQRLAVILLCCASLLAATLGLRSTPVLAQALQETVSDGGKLEPADIALAVDQIDALARLFAAFAARDSNGFASERWRRLGVNYAGTAEILRGLLAAQLVVIDDLPAGRASGLLYDGRIVLDSSLDGVWLAALPQAEDAAELSAAARSDLLVPALMAALARALPPRDWPWLADHLAALGGFDELAEDAAARPLLARYFRAKDAYLWLAMTRIAEGNPTRRRALARRQVDIFRAVRGLRAAVEEVFGPGPADRLRGDWSAYVSLVDGFAATRGWLLLDPTLRLTQLGAAARAEFDAVDLAAAEVVASAPRSAIAAAMSDSTRLTPQVPRPDAAAPAPVTLAAIVPAVEAPAPAEQAFDLPLVALALKPEYSVAAAGPAATGEMAARLREALARPDPRPLLAEQERALKVTRDELSGLRAQVSELSAALRARAAEAGAPLAAPTPPAVPAVTAPAAVEAALPGQGGEGVPGPWPWPGPGLPWQFYLILVAVGGLVVGLLLWRRRRRPSEGVPAAPLLLAGPGPDTPLVLAPVTAKPAAPAAAERPTQPPAAAPAPAPKKSKGPQEPRPTLPPLPRRGAVETAGPPQDTKAPLRVSGIAPSTPAAQAAMNAATARAAAQGVAPGREADVAMHPIIVALRSGNLPLFELLFSELTDLHSPQLQRIVYGGRGEDLLIVCRAVGVDKLLFGSILLLTDHLRGGDAADDPARAAEILRMFDRMPPETAQKVLAKWQRNWSGHQRTRPPSGA